MKKVLAVVALVWGGASLFAAQSVTAPTPTAAANARAEAAKYREWVNRNCVGCHNNRVKQPPDDPINLEAASLDDVVANAASARSATGGARDAAAERAASPIRT
jgi:mono/diheme cytochrome c family protein